MRDCATTTHSHTHMYPQQQAGRGRTVLYLIDLGDVGCRHESQAQSRVANKLIILDQNCCRVVRPFVGGYRTVYFRLTRVCCNLLRTLRLRPKPRSGRPRRDPRLSRMQHSDVRPRVVVSPRNERPWKVPRVLLLQCKCCAVRADCYCCCCCEPPLPIYSSVPRRRRAASDRGAARTTAPSSPTGRPEPKPLDSTCFCGSYYHTERSVDMAGYLLLLLLLRVAIFVVVRQLSSGGGAPIMLCWMLGGSGDVV